MMSRLSSKFQKPLKPWLHQNAFSQSGKRGDGRGNTLLVILAILVMLVAAVEVIEVVEVVMVVMVVMVAKFGAFGFVLSDSL